MEDVSVLPAGDGSLLLVTTVAEPAAPTAPVASRRRRILAEPYRFDDEVDAAELEVDRAAMARAGARGSAATLVGTWAKFVIQSATTVLLAHIISPRDFGVVAMVTAISGLGDLLRDLGLSFAVIQTRHLTRNQASTMFWYSTGLGSVVALILIAFTGPIANFYNQPNVATIVPVMAVSIVVSSLGAQHIALLDRSLGFTRVMAGDLVSAFLSSIIAAVLAIGGAGYWSLVALNVSMPLIRTVVAWTNVRWRPNRPGTYTSVSALVSFGFYQLIAQLLNYGSRNVDNVVVGRKFGAAVLGQYSQAYQLLLIPLQQVNAPLQRVAIPLLSKTFADPPAYRSYFRLSIRLISLTLVPLFCVAAILAKPIVRTVLGPEWDQAAELFQILCLAGVTQSLGYASSWLFISAGRGKAQVALAMVTRPIVIISFLVGAIWGVQGLTVAYTVTSIAMVVPVFHFAMKGTPVHLTDLLGGLRELLLILPLCGGTAYFSNRVISDAGWPPYAALLISGSLALIEYIGCWALLPSCRATAQLLWRAAR